MPKLDEPVMEREQIRTVAAKPRRWGKLVFFLLFLAAAGVGIYFFLRYESTYESTDDAEIGAHLSAVSARVAGTVTAVYFEENQFVQAGQVIAELDPRDFKVALDQARGQLSQALAQVKAENPNVPITQVTNQTSISTTQSDIANAEAALAAAERDAEASQADLKQAEANSAKAQADLARYRPLVEKTEVSREQFDQVVATAQAQQAIVESRRAAVASAHKVVEQRSIAVQQARFRFNEAQQNAPHQVAIRQANLTSREAVVKTIAAQVERAEARSVLLQSDIRDQRHRQPAHRGSGAAHFRRPAIAASGADRRPVGYRQLQGNSITGHAPGPARHHPCGRL